MSGGCKGLHCDGCRHGAGAGIGALVLLIGVLVLAANRRAIGHACSDALRIAVDVLEIGAVTATAAAVTAGSVWLIRRQHARRLAARQRAAVTPLRAWVIHPPAHGDRPGLGTPRTPYLRVLPGSQHDARSGVRRSRGEQSR
jgi:hypothetical protein